MDKCINCRAFTHIILDCSNSKTYFCGNKKSRFQNTSLPKDSDACDDIICNDSEFTVGETFYATVPLSEPEQAKIVIDHILPSYFEGQTLIIYRALAKNIKEWHECMCYASKMRFYMLNK